MCFGKRIDVHIKCELDTIGRRLGDEFVQFIACRCLQHVVRSYRSDDASEKKSNGSVDASSMSWFALMKSAMNWLSTLVICWFLLWQVS